MHAQVHARTHVHTPHVSLWTLSRITGWASSRKVKPIWILLKQETVIVVIVVRNSEWQWHQLGHMQICTLLQIDNLASTTPLSFLQAGCPSCRPTNRVKALKTNDNADTKKLSLHHLYKIISDYLTLHSWINEEKSLTESDNMPQNSSFCCKLHMAQVMKRDYYYYYYYYIQQMLSKHWKVIMHITGKI